MRALLRRLFGLAPYEDSIVRRSGRVKYSLYLASAQVPTGRVLDIGCSMGWFEDWALRFTDVRVTAIDASVLAVEAARRVAPAAEYHVGSVLCLPFEDNTFDGAVMFEVIEHLPRKTEAQALAEVRRVLRPGAWFLCSTPNAHPLSMVLDPAWYLGHRHYTKTFFERLLRSAGFDVMSMEVRGGFAHLGGTLLFYAFKWLLGADPQPGPEATKRLDDEFFCEGGFANIFATARKAQETA